MAKTLAADKKTSAKTRRIQSGSYASFRLQKKLASGDSGLPSAFVLLKNALGILKRHWKLFGGILLIYTVLNVLLVQGLGMASDLGDVKESLEDRFAGGLAQLATGATLFVALLGSSGGLTPTASVYQLIISLVVSLATIWTLREVFAGHTVRIRDGFYKGMRPFVPFVLVLCVIGLQLVPMILGGTVYATVVSSGVAASAAELLVWALVFFVFALISLYMLCSSLFALYIVCLPDVQPVQALRSANALVRNRRWTILRKIIFLPVALALIGALIVIPLILLAAPLAGLVFFGLSMLGIVVAHSYMYGLYRSLL